MNPWSLPGSLSAFGSKYGPDGVELLIQFSVVLAVGLIGGWLLRRRSPLLRSLVYRITLAGAVIAALFSFGVNGRVPSRWTVQVADNGGTTFVLGRRTAEGGRRTKDQGRRTADEGRRTVDGGPATDARALVPPVQFLQPDTQSLIPNTQYLRPNTQYLRPNTQYLLWAWLVGAVGMLGWLFVGWLQIGALRRRSARLTDGAAFELLGALRRDGRLKIPELLISKELGSPFLAGILRPAMILPASYETKFDSRELRAIFAHELAHLDRGDCGWNLFAAVIKSAAWFHPLVWLLCRELEDAAEDVCDQAALGASQEGREYAACLLRLSESLSGSWPQRSIAAGVYSSSLGRRIRRILLGEPDARPVSGWARVGLLATAFSVGALSLLLISVSSRPRQTGLRTATDRQAAQTIIRQSIAAEARLKTLTGRITIAGTGGYGQRPNQKEPEEFIDVEMQKPYIGRSQATGWFRGVSVCDGKTFSVWVTYGNHIYYGVSHWTRMGFAIEGTQSLPETAFYGSGRPTLRDYLNRRDLHTAGTSLVDGVRCEVVESAEPENAGTAKFTTRRADGYYIVKHVPSRFRQARTLLYFGPDHLLRKITVIGEDAYYSATLTDIRTDVGLNPADFKFHRPAGAMPFSRINLNHDFHGSLIQGPAPNFSLPDSNGRSVTLEGTLKGQKIVLLALIDHFDFHRAELEELRSTYHTLNYLGFNALVIDINDTPAELKKGLAQTHLPYPVLTPASSAQAKALLTGYGVREFPTCYLIDRHGRAIWSDYGYVSPPMFYINIRMDHPENRQRTRWP